MVSRQSAGHSAATNTHTTPSTSSIKPTGWIRSTSVTKPAPFADRTNLPSTSISAPLSSIFKPLAPHSARSPAPSVHSNGPKQAKLSSFFTPHTAPPTAAAAARLATQTSGRKEKQSGCIDSPSLHRAQRKNGAEAGPSKLPALELDDELDARATNLLRGRFGSVTRSLNASRSSTPTRPISSPISDPQPIPQAAQVQARAGADARLTMSLPRVPPRPRPSKKAQITPARRKKEAQHPPSSPAPFEPTLMAESLSNFTPPAWERSRSDKMALFQRLAGVPKKSILIFEKHRMQDELNKAHKRLLANHEDSPLERPLVSREDASPSKATLIRSPIEKQARNRQIGSPSRSRVNDGAALSASPSKRNVIVSTKSVLRSPTTNRRIYALETQLSGASALTGGRSVSLQPLRLDIQEEAAEQRRAVSQTRGVADGANADHTIVVSDETMTEDESETLSLPWPEVEKASQADALGEETQLLPWNDDEEDQMLDHPPDRSQQPVTEVPTSDDEDLLLQFAIPSSPSSSLPASASRSTSPTSSSLRAAGSPSKKRRRTHSSSTELDSSPTVSLTRSDGTTPSRRLPKVSPITLTSTLGSSGNRFDKVVTALQKEERRANTGMQLNLNSFLSSSRPNGHPSPSNRQGLSEDLEDELSDDDIDEAHGDTTVNGMPLNLEQHRDGAEDEAEETHPLLWSSQTQTEPMARPGLRPLQPSSSQCTTSSRTSSDAISLPSEANLYQSGNTPFRSFFEHL
ncbi:uncharacterized protein MEPE_06668 [Melanopsichium pennsylvanicum]|uniref:Uncharacterized protein n=2 Tax=Melanopsichium pennsylvanicum TaxID=63383 RepID=A0AAJ4XTU0_9BASI|nr:putative protein [Melanopsichium pennsylvanicum 4]SNX87957.1 uncharacterized protein MEPE_06668 [Melanopsichium pennsylvanicum]